jgi:F-type H+-transporting ATPase subunit alpha
VEILKQPKNQPVPVEKQICIMWAAMNSHLDGVAVQDIARFQAGWFELLDKAYHLPQNEIATTGKLSAPAEESLAASILEFKATFISSKPESAASAAS